LQSQIAKLAVFVFNINQPTRERMKKEKLTIEYPLNNASEAILWKMIGTPLGLAEWFSDAVTVEGNEYTFSWEGHEQIAILKQVKEGKLICFQWEDDKDTEAYFQLEIVSLDLSGHVGLIVTDYATPGEREDAILLWNKQVENLCRIGGM